MVVAIRHVSLGIVSLAELKMRSGIPIHIWTSNATGI